ncbi:MAG: CPBP family intramembrane metalloprotease [Oscillospiraceae bacterium]|jgi:membrane protease YdiL (CAAX protease family)|nr:CPBP family intramembrane metalloprotease [Oscillospiraceae bacterium]
MSTYNLPRRVWRAIYPALLYLAITFLVPMIISMFYGGSLGAQAAANGGVVDQNELTQKLTDFLTGKIMQIALAGYIVSALLFSPMWRITKKKYKRWNGGGFSIVAALLVIGAGIGVNLLLSAIIDITKLTEYFESYSQITEFITSGSFIIQLITVGIVAPVAEELCFRGVTLNRMSNIKIWAAVAIQAVIFGAFHLNLLQGLYAALIGVFLGFLVTRFRSLTYAVIAHIAFNSFTVLAGNLLPDTDIPTLVMLLLGIILTAGCILGLLKCKRPPEPVVDEEIIEPIEVIV